ncbi:MAG: FAD-binding oxidoreductase [Candidatus Dormibacteria bacterium]
MSEVWRTPPPLRWWGWGARATEVNPALHRLLQTEVGASDTPARRVALHEVTLPPSRLSPADRGRLAAVVGEDWVDAASEARIRHAAGRSYLDLLALRSGRLDAAPDAVVHPGDEAEIVELLALCGDIDCAVVPFGGGTSVVGGVTPLSGGHAAVISLDLGRLDQLRAVDSRSLTARMSAGLRGPQVESRLAGHGLALDHFPQSFEYATVGGYAATRSAGQASTAVGRFDELVKGLRCVTPSGMLAVEAQPGAASGPSLLQLLLGSEGTLGVISEVTAQLRRLPPVRRYEGFLLPNFNSGVEAFRELAQAGLAPDVGRLADESETRLSFAAGDRGSRSGRLLQRYLRFRQRDQGVLVIAGVEGSGASTGFRMRVVAQALRDHGAISLGRAAGTAWRRSRFDGPYLRDALLDAGVMVETVETATSWSGLPGLRRRVVAAISTALTSQGTPALIGCHVSHVYPTGASLYVTVIARQNADPIAQWSAAKRAAMDAILEAGATITHHHAVGTDHAQYLRAEIGERGIGVLRALKAELDPAGIMNPEKLVLAEQTALQSTRVR